MPKDDHQDDEEHIDMNDESETDHTSEESEKDTDERDETDKKSSVETPAKSSQSGPHPRLWQWLMGNKKLSIPVLVVVVLGVLFAIPFTRYALAGLVWKQDFKVSVVDSQTGKPVSSAAVTLRGKTAMTDNAGQATLHVAVGKSTVMVAKKYYKSTSQSVTVQLTKQSPLVVSFVADGRQVPITVVNFITRAPLVDATVSASGADVKTDKKGQAVIVLPANKTSATGSVAASGYNKQDITIKVTASEDSANVFALTPSGKMYFLSNASGKVDVVKADLDGKNRQTVLAGTGKEDKNETVLLASQDWKYLALLSKRDGGDDAKLFMISTADDSLTTMDEGQAYFNLAGWSGHTFVYHVTRYKKGLYEPKRDAIKSFNAESKKLSTLDETDSSGNNYYDGVEVSYTTLFILDNQIAYGKNASVSGGASAKQATFNVIRPDGTDKKVIKGWDISPGYSSGMYLRAYEAQSTYLSLSDSIDQTLYEFEDGKLSAVAGKKASDIYNIDYKTFLFSPSNKQTFWTEQRDGKFSLVVGDSSGDNGKTVGSVGDYQAFGWFTDDYLLVSKSGSELYIVSAAGLNNGFPQKITDYYKPPVAYPGYGRGYGGGY